MAPRWRHALVLGRYQPLHRGHEALIAQALAESDAVSVGIGSSQEAGTWENPFSAAERTDMVRRVFGDRVDVVWVPDIFDPPRYVDHVRSLMAPFDVVFGNDETTLALFGDVGIDIRAPGLHERHRWEGSAVRRLLAEDDPAWLEAVSTEVALSVENIQGRERLQRIARTHAGQ